MDSILSAPANEMSSLSVKSQRIIVIDDDCDDIEIIKQILNELSEEHQVDCTSEAEKFHLFLDGLEDEELPTLLIIDYNMPKLSGIDIIASLNTNNRYAGIPKVIYSATLRGKDMNDCFEAGATACYKKGTYLKQIKEQIEDMLQCCK